MQRNHTLHHTPVHVFRSELGILEEKLTIERLKEQSWRDEYKEISGSHFVLLWCTWLHLWYSTVIDFSAEADAKHGVYQKNRTKYLEKCKVCEYG